MGTIAKIEVEDYLCGENQYPSEQNLRLYEAAENGEIESLRAALSSGANPNFFHKSKDGVLHAASRNSNAECAKDLIKSGALVSAANISNRNTPIHEAASTGSKDVCSVLIASSSPVTLEKENLYGNTALHAASRAGNPEIVKLLLDNSADPNKQNHRGSTALHIACFLASPSANSAEESYIKIASLLLSHKESKVDIQDVNGYTALHIAAQRGCNEMVELLINSGASLSIRTGIDSKGRGGRTPEAMARFGGNDSTVQLIRQWPRQQSL
eukprot:scaffold117292_cov70-Cyclotella_meneghiniana.AAC.2